MHFLIFAIPEESGTVSPTITYLTSSLLNQKKEKSYELVRFIYQAQVGKENCH